MNSYSLNVCFGVAKFNRRTLEFVVEQTACGNKGLLVTSEDWFIVTCKTCRARGVITFIERLIGHEFI